MTAAEKSPRSVEELTLEGLTGVIWSKCPDIYYCQVGGHRKIIWCTETKMLMNELMQGMGWTTLPPTMQSLENVHAMDDHDTLKLLGT